MKSIALVAFAVLLAPAVVRGHGVITAAVGQDGPEGRALGTVLSTPRDGTKRNPFQQDASIIRDREVQSGKATACGRTLGGGTNEMSGVQALMSELGGLPMVQPGGTLTMTLHQVNGDGAGPYSCELSTDGTGNDFKQLAITQQVPGRNSRNNAGAKTDHPLAVTIPQDTQCTGADSACMVRCRNSAAAGPFGGCVPFMMMGTAAAGGNGNNTAAGASAGAGANAGAAAKPAAGAKKTRAAAKTAATAKTAAAGQGATRRRGAAKNTADNN